MSTENRKVQVVMLATDKASKIWSNKGRTLYFNQSNFNDPDDEIKYLLYFLSDEEIKEGDWYIRDGKIIKDNDDGHGLCSCKKIIATTNPELKIDPTNGSNFIADKPLPRPSDKFIQKFIEEYNKGNIITEALVEYDWSCEYTDLINETGEYNGEYTLKVASDNTIIIHPVEEDNWNEIFNILNDTSRDLGTKLAYIKAKFNSPTKK